MSDENIIYFDGLKENRDHAEARSFEEIEEVAWDLMNSALAMSIAMSKGDDDDGRQRILEWLNGDGILEEHLSGKWSDLSILNGDLEIRVQRKKP